MVTRDAVREPKVIVSKGVVGLLFDYYLVAPDRLGIVLHPEIIVGKRVADLIVLSLGTSGVSAGLRRTLHCNGERECDKQPEPADGKQLIIFPVYACRRAGSTESYQHHRHIKSTRRPGAPRARINC